MQLELATERGRVFGKAVEVFKALIELDPSASSYVCS